MSAFHSAFVSSPSKSGSRVRAQMFTRLPVASIASAPVARTAAIAASHGNSQTMTAWFRSDAASATNAAATPAPSGAGASVVVANWLSDVMVPAVKLNVTPELGIVSE